MAVVATFDPALTEDRDKIRLIVGDTDIDAAYLADDTYDALLTMYPSFVKATLAAFDAIGALLAVPDIHADWYRELNNEEAYASLMDRRDRYAAENGVGRYTTRSVHSYRGDSEMTEGLYSE